MTTGPVSWSGSPVTVRVPATSANLGPGFDAIGLALTLHDEVQASVTGAGLIIDVRGSGEHTAQSGEQHLVVRAMRAAFGVTGAQPPGIALCCTNAIPQGCGLGSSAAAIVAGLLAARALAGAAPLPAAGAVPSAGAPRGTAIAPGARLLPDAALLDLAAGLEGHADNVAACLRGGLTIAWTAGGRTRSTRVATVPGLTPVLFYTEKSLPTAAARELLPPAVPHADAARNAARAALLIAALGTDPSLLLDATEDFLHQRYRAAAMPATAALIRDLRAAGIPAVLSGAGPAVLAFAGPGLAAGPDAIAAVAARCDAGWSCRTLAIDAGGARVTTAPAAG